MIRNPKCAHKGCGVSRATAEDGFLGWHDGYCGTHAPPLPPKPRAPRRSPEAMVEARRVQREDDAAALRLMFPGAVVIDVDEAEGPEAKAEALRAAVAKLNARSS